MKLYKNQIEFLEKYAAKDSRNNLDCAYLDLSIVCMDKNKRIGRLVATNGFVLGCVLIELTDIDTCSMRIPIYLLATLAKQMSHMEYIIVSTLMDQILIKYDDITLSVPIKESNFPKKYAKIFDVFDKPNYCISLTIEYLENIIKSHKKLGYDNLTFEFTTDRKPVFIQNNDGYITAVMPRGNSKKGALQHEEA